jgi:Inheritance of peroxisomes protein 1
MSKSQCWCVDGESIFVVKTGMHSYWRIEIESDENGSQTALLKEVFTEILRYEKTACPFTRGFTVPLPDPPETPIKKKPWKAPERPTVEVENRSPSPQAILGATSRHGDLLGRKVEIIEDLEATPRRSRSPSMEHKRTITEPVMKPGRLQSPFLVSQPVPIPPKHSLKSSSSSDSLYQSAASSLGSSSMESFFSLLEPGSPTQATSPSISNPSTRSVSPVSHDDISHDDIRIPRRRHRRDHSDITIRGSTVGAPKFDGHRSRTPISRLPSNLAGSPQTPPLIKDFDSADDEEMILTPPQDEPYRRRTSVRDQRRRGGRDLSPMPLPANLYTPNSSRMRSQRTNAIIQKTCTLMLKPPSYLIYMMLTIASKIANGAVKGVTYGYGEGGEQIPCSWEYGSDDGFDGWEDDYGISLHGNSNPQDQSRKGSLVKEPEILEKEGKLRRRRRSEGLGWEVD